MSMSAADWTRLQRQKAGTQYARTVMVTAPNGVRAEPTNKDIAPVMPPAGPSPSPKSVLIPCSLAGKPKTLRPASDWTNYAASQVTDYVLNSGGTGRAGETFENQNYTRMRVTRLCSCVTTVLNPKRTSCDACAIGQHMRLG
jgi:hypothetical protein